MKWRREVTKENLKYSDVFVPGGFPLYTYNPRESLLLERKLGEVTDNLCKLVTVTGHTKSGKTVLTRKILPTETSVWVDGGSASDEEDFWGVILERLDASQEISYGTTRGNKSSVDAKAKAGANLLIMKGEGEIGGAYERHKENHEGRSRKISIRVAALEALKKSKIPLIIDDFHYLPKDMQGSIVRALKPLIFDGLPVVVIAIPHRRYDAMKVEREMTGRVLPLSIPVWDEKDLAYIPEKGFSLVGIKVAPEVIPELTKQAIGSPHLMQEFCRAIGKDSQESGASFVYGKLQEVFKGVAETIGRPIFEKLARGPRQRTDRVRRRLKDGRDVDIYELVLHGLAHIKPGLVTLEYEDLRAAIRDVSAAQVPQLQEISRVLKHMAEIAATDQSSTPVIDFEEEEKKLHITDPFFAFYLRWGDLHSL